MRHLFLIASLAALLAIACGDDQQFVIVNGCELKPGTNCAGLNLSETNLAAAEIPGSNFTGTNFADAVLSGANLSRSDLSRANLRGANLSNANLRDCIMDDADLEGANLSGVQLQGATGLPDQCGPDRDCPGTQMCNEGVCVQPMAENNDPNNVDCQRVGCPCETSRDCPPDLACEPDFRECLPRECDADTDCPDPQLRCFGGICRFE